MKISIKLPLILILLFLFTITQISCDSKEQPIESSEETQSELESSNSICFNYPLRDYLIGKSNDSKLYWDCSGNDFGDYLGEYNGLNYNGFHSGEDWNLKGGDDGSIDLGLPVYSIGIGKVVKVSPIGRNGSLGYLVVIEHNGNFVIPSKELSSNGQEASYKDEVVNKIYSAYIHLKDIEVKENDDVDEDSVIGYIMDPGGGPHLHFEIRKNNDNHSSDWSLIGDKTNWRMFPGGSYNGYYKDLQKMIDAGFRDPSDFIEANYKSSEEYKSQEEAVEEEIEKEKTYKTTAKGKIAFTSDRDGNSEIYIMNIDGSGLENITNNPARDAQPSFSPDGSKIAFSSDRVGDWEIYIMNVDGSEPTRLTDKSADDMQPCFSPDGSKIAFSSSDHVIAFSSDHGYVGNWDIYIMDVYGLEETRLTGKRNFNGNPSFSPDGSKIVFQSANIGWGEIYIMNVDGSGETQLTDNWHTGFDDRYPCFSPDGSKIVFQSDRFGNNEICIMNVDDSEKIRLTNSSADDLYPRFSPDGSKIAFTSFRDGNPEIYIMNVDGSELVNLTNNPAYDDSPCFSP